MNFETARSSTDDRVFEFLMDSECKSVVSLYLKGMRDWEYRHREDRIFPVVSPLNTSFLHAFLSRDLLPMKSPFPDLPNNSVADPPLLSPDYELKPAASLHPASYDASLENLFVPLISVTPSKCNCLSQLCLLELFPEFCRIGNQSSFMLCGWAGDK